MEQMTNRKSNPTPSIPIEDLATMLLSQIERFLRRTGMSRATFGRLAARDPRFVTDLRNGREPRPRMVRRVETFMTAYLAADSGSEWEKPNAC